MNKLFKTASALKHAQPDLIQAVGEAMVVFGAIDGIISFQLGFLISDKILMRHIEKMGVARRLEIFGDLLKEQGRLDNSDIDKTVSRAKELFEKRNIIAHNQVYSRSGNSKQFIARPRSLNKQELSAEDIAKIARDADAIYDEISQLFFSNAIRRIPSSKGTVGKP